MDRRIAVAISAAVMIGKSIGWGYSYPSRSVRSAEGGEGRIAFSRLDEASGQGLLTMPLDPVPKPRNLPHRYTLSFRRMLEVLPCILITLTTVDRVLKKASRTIHLIAPISVRVV